MTTKQATRLLRVFLASKSPRTARDYRRDLTRLAEFLDLATLEAAVCETLAARGRAYEIASLWRAEMRSRLAAGTVNRRISTLHSLSRTARSLGLIEWRLAVAPLPTSRLRDVAGPGREAVRAMLAHTQALGGPKGARDTAIVYLLYGLALRRSELVGLDVEHVDLRRPAVAVLGKGRAEREWLELPLPVQEAVAAWLAQRGHEPGPLFTHCSRAHETARLSADGVYALIQSLGEIVGVRATPHGLRHTAITDAILMGHSLPDVQKFSRHSDLRTLQAYFDRLAGVAGDIASAVVSGL